MATNSSETLNWQQLDSPLLKAVIPAFTDALGDGPGKLPFDAFLATMSEAFPNMTADQLKASVRLSTWGARNVILMRLAELPEEEVYNMTSELAALGADDDTSWAMAEYVVQVSSTADRVDARPMLGLLSQLATENGISYPTA